MPTPQPTAGASILDDPWASEADKEAFRRAQPGYVHVDSRKEVLEKDAEFQKYITLKKRGVSLNQLRQKIHTSGEGYTQDDIDLFFTDGEVQEAGPHL